ncbi:efflux RND transporter periplasmic adaptor subunit [Shewanella surugensis]|uniref:Efflux RND transporter periplasmic adaptor subunit n=1 Tax=Shewanella surugensis TaxID=212020 RepID=A0ABT0LBQ4_9GAMM|nr:efflux RND transporter periplasmic adaptor subunit [Shewanella surugensis]MCL1124795.1 efflux RND transporter periplasmic adaptor subunit [Shewanella surugensis]
MYCYIKMVSRSLLTLSLLTAFSLFADDKPLVHVTETKQWDGGIQKTLYCRGDVLFRPHISSHVQAQLDWILPVDTEVKKGDLIAKQNDFYLVQTLASLTSRLAAAKAQASFSAQEYQRIQSLDKQDMVSVSDLSRAELDAQVSKQGYQALQAEQRTLKHQIAHLDHYAPADGKVFELNAQPGEWVEMGDSLLVFLPMDNQEVVCRMSLDLYQQVEQLSLASFYLEEGISLQLNRLASEVNEADQTFNLHFNFKGGASAALFLGQRVTVKMQMHADDLSLIAYDALNLNDNEYYVWQVDEDNKVKQVPIKIVDTLGQHAVIQSPIKVGQWLVVRGGKSLKQSDAVIVANKNDTNVNNAKVRL